MDEDVEEVTAIGDQFSDADLSYISANDNGSMTPTSPLSPSRRSRRSTEVNLVGALKRLSDHVGQRRTEKMAVSFTKVHKFLVLFLHINLSSNALINTCIRLYAYSRA